MPRLEAVIFDLWNTLIADPPELSDRRDAYRLEGVARVLAAYGLPHDAGAVREAYRAMLDEMSSRHREGRDLQLEERVGVLLSNVNAGPARGGSLETDMAAVFVEAALKIVPPALPGALEAVRSLRSAGIKVGLVSNTGVTPGRGLRRVLEVHGLAPHFDVLTFSDEVGLCKPAPPIYRRTLVSLGADAASTVFVGDDPELDVAGPLRAGLWTVQVGERDLDGVRPHGRIGGLDELPEALASLGFAVGS